MLRTLTKPLLFIILVGISQNLGTSIQAKDPANLVVPIRDLFSHKKHQESFHSLNVQCTNCHSFSVKPIQTDPLSSGVEEHFLKPNKGVCHQCHLGSVALGRPQQCTLCHQKTENLKPADHFQNWRTRHGHFAQLDADSCKACHTQRSCDTCHTMRDVMKPQVHRPGFRMFHSIEARANPLSCATCHSSASYCVQCHTTGKVK